MGCPVVESWIIEGEQDKAYHFGLTAPVGSWIVGVNVTDPEIWQEVKDGNVKGFSIEGHFNELAVTMTAANIEAEIMREISDVLAAIK
jgi:hypothetical protein